MVKVRFPSYISRLTNRLSQQPESRHTVLVARNGSTDILAEATVLITTWVCRENAQFPPSSCLMKTTISKTPSRPSRWCRSCPCRRSRRPRRKPPWRTRHRSRGCRECPGRTSWSLPCRGRLTYRHHTCPRSSR